MLACQVEFRSSLLRDSISVLGIPIAPCMSIYRSPDRTPRSDVHHVAHHVTSPVRSGPERTRTSDQQDWAQRRRSRPAESLLPATIRWMAGLPLAVRPCALGIAFPRIANLLARLWPNAAALTDYMTELLVDRRGGRKGFPVDVLLDLHKLRTYHSTLNPDQPPRSVARS